MVDQYDRWIPDWPGQQPYDDPQYVRWMQQHRGMQGQGFQQAQMLTQNQTSNLRPYIDARMLEAKSYEDVEKFQLEPGASQMFYMADRSGFLIKEQGPNGYEISKYPKAPPDPPKEKFDPSQYVRIDELEGYMMNIINRAQQQRVEKGAE